jgi:hypothetical protein
MNKARGNLRFFFFCCSRLFPFWWGCLVVTYVLTGITARQGRGRRYRITS